MWNICNNILMKRANHLCFLFYSLLLNFFSFVCGASLVHLFIFCRNLQNALIHARTLAQRSHILHKNYILLHMQKVIRWILRKRIALNPLKQKQNDEEKKLHVKTHQKIVIKKNRVKILKEKCVVHIFA